MRGLEKTRLYLLNAPTPQRQQGPPTAAVEAGPMQPAHPLPPGHQRPGRRGTLCHTWAQDAAGRPPARKPAPRHGWTPQHGEPCRLRTRARACVGSAGTEGPALPPQQGKGRSRSGRNSVGCSQPAPPLDTGSRGPAGHLNACGWRGTKKAPNPQKWCVIWCVKTLTC